MIWRPIAALLFCLGLGPLTADAQLLTTGVGPGSAGGAGGPTLTLSGPGGGLVSVPSTNFTVTYSGGTFNGTTNTVTLTTSGTGGTFTSVPAGVGTNPITVTPTAASTSFTFTYTPPATPATYVITMTNSMLIPNNGSPANYNATSSLVQALVIGIP